jgi:hypothetical protein
LHTFIAPEPLNPPYRATATREYTGHPTPASLPGSGQSHVLHRCGPSVRDGCMAPGHGSAGRLAKVSAA